MARHPHRCPGKSAAPTMFLPPSSRIRRTRDQPAQMEVAFFPAGAPFRRPSCSGFARLVRRLLTFLAAAALIWMLLPEPVRAQSNQRPVAVPGTYPAITDTDGLPGETVLLNGAGSF